MWAKRSSEISDRPRVAQLIWWSTVLLLSALHLFIRANGIGTPELWLDESSTWGVARRPLLEVLTLPTEFHSQPPLYYVFLHFLMKLSDARWFMRGFSWLCCLGLIQVVLFFVEELNLLARVFFCGLFLYSQLPGYLSSALRPYGMAAIGTFVSTLLFVALVREPTRPRAIRYAIAGVVMLYTMAFDVWVIVAHGLCYAGLLVGRAITDGLRATLARQRAALVALAAVGLAYLPYLWMALHWQYQKSTAQTAAYALELGHHAYVANEFLGFAPLTLTLFFALIAVGLWAELRERRPLVLVWLLIAFGQVSFVVYFMYGRNSIGPTGRYMTPALPAAFMLAALGFQQLSARQGRALWPAVPLVLAYLAWPAMMSFQDYVKAPAPRGEWGKLHASMRRRPGNKGMFFDIGYAGQDFEYVIRNDPTITTFTMRGPGGATGGDDHLDAGYIKKSLADTHESIRCYFYQLENPEGVYATTFVPEMKRLGYVQEPPAGKLHVFCRVP